MGEVGAALGFNFSIYLMLGIPILIVLGFVLGLFLNYKKFVAKKRTIVLK